MGTVMRMKDSELKGGLDAVREPVVVVSAKKRSKGRGQNTAAARDPHQVKRARKPKIVRGPHWDDNGRVYLTGLDLNTTMGAEDFGAFLASLVETADPLDRAHCHRRKVHEDAPDAIDESWVLLSHQEVDHPLNSLGRRTGKPKPTTRRRYHPSQMTAMGIAQDSMHDRIFEIARTIQREGVNLGWAIHHRGNESPAHLDREQVLAGLSYEQARQKLRPKIHDHMDEDEKRLHARASRLLAEAGLKPDEIEV